jgi:hypothetical protein
MTFIPLTTSDLHRGPLDQTPEHEKRQFLKMGANGANGVLRRTDCRDPRKKG